MPDCFYFYPIQAKKNNVSRQFRQLYMDNDRMIEYTECMYVSLSHLQGSFKKWVTTLLFL